MSPSIKSVGPPIVLGLILLDVDILTFICPVSEFLVRIRSIFVLKAVEMTSFRALFGVVFLHYTFHLLDIRLRERFLELSYDSLVPKENSAMFEDMPAFFASLASLLSAFRALLNKLVITLEM